MRDNNDSYKVLLGTRSDDSFLSEGVNSIPELFTWRGSFMGKVELDQTCIIRVRTYFVLLGRAVSVATLYIRAMRIR